MLLIAVARMGPAPLTVVADRLQLDRTTLTRNLAALEEWIEVSSDPADRRSKILAISGAGLAAIERCTPAWEKAQAQVTAQLGEVGVGVALAALNQLSALE